jgi:hypothetical protein
MEAPEIIILYIGLLQGNIMSTVKADNFTWKTGQATGQSGTTVTGDQIVYGTGKAWITYDGSNQVIKGSYNISSVTRVATGQFTYAMNTSMIDTLFPVSIGGINNDSASTNIYPGFTNNFICNWGWSYTTNQFRSTHLWTTNAAYNPYWVSYVVTR